MIVSDYGEQVAVRCDVADLGNEVYRIDNAGVAAISDVDVCLRGDWACACGTGIAEDLARTAAEHLGVSVRGRLSVATRAEALRKIALIAW